MIEYKYKKYFPTNMFCKYAHEKLRMQVVLSQDNHYVKNCIERGLQRDS